MYLGIIFTLIICSVIIVVGFFTCYYAFKKKLVNPTITKSYGTVILSTSIVYASGGIPSLFAYYGKLKNLEDFFLYVIIIAFIACVFTVFYLTYKTRRSKKLTYTFTGIYILALIFFSYMVLTHWKMESLEKMYFTYDFRFDKNILIFFSISIIPIIIMLFVDLIRSIKIYYHQRIYKHRTYLMYSISVFTLYLPSYIAAAGFIRGWQLVMLCIIAVIAMMIGLYAAITKEDTIADVKMKAK